MRRNGSDPAYRMANSGTERRGRHAVRTSGAFLNSACAMDSAGLGPTDNPGDPEERPTHDRTAPEALPTDLLELESTAFKTLSYGAKISDVYLNQRHPVKQFRKPRSHKDR